MTPAPPPVGPRRRVWRWARRVLLVLVAVVAAALVALFRIDLGPGVRGIAEREATKFLQRPMHIGRLHAELDAGVFVLEDVVIEGPTPDARPFLTAQRIRVEVPWWTLFRRELFVQVRMTDWDMVMETSPDGKVHLPHLTPGGGSGGPSRFRKTVPYVYADHGRFTYDDHDTPWSVVAPNLNFDLARADNLDAYVGTAQFRGGTVKVQDFLPMSADLTTRFTLDHSLVHVHHIDLVTDGAHSSVTGEVDFSHWPEQTYRVESDVDFARMREIFFAHERFRVAGNGHFSGTFHLYSGGRDLRGRFRSPLARVNDLVFPNLTGSLTWLPDSFSVTDAAADFCGGRMGFAYGIEPAASGHGSLAVFTTNYRAIDLQALGRVLGWQVIQPAGQAGGYLSMQWPNGRFSDGVEGSGETVVTPAGGIALAGTTLGPGEPRSRAISDEPFDPDRPLGPLPVGGEVHYRFDRDGLEFTDSWAASASTRVAFRGHAGFGAPSDVGFDVTSHDWQESDRVLVAIMDAFGSPTHPVEVGGGGQFHGRMTNTFAKPRIEGEFSGGAMWAWGVDWGAATGHLVIDNSYLDLANAVITRGPEGVIQATGRFALGYPRQDHGEEIDAHVTATRWPLDDFRTAFNLADWPIDGTVTTDLTLKGFYESPLGSGTLHIDDGVAWGETFEKSAGDLQFEGTGLRISRITMTKGPGTVRGAAWIGWDGTYSFDAAGERIPVESLTSFTVPRAPLTGVLRFDAAGAGAFDSPSYEFKGVVADLFAGGEEIGQLTGQLEVEQDVLTVTQLEAGSVRMQVSGTGRIALDDVSDADSDVPVQPDVVRSVPAVHRPRDVTVHPRDSQRVGANLRPAGGRGAPRCGRRHRRGGPHAVRLRAAQPGADPARARRRRDRAAARAVRG